MKCCLELGRIALDGGGAAVGSLILYEGLSKSFQSRG